MNIINEKIYFNTIECAFQATKIIHLKEKISVEDYKNYFKHFSVLNNVEAKKAGNRLNLNLAEYEVTKFDYMAELLSRKFSDKNPELKERLINTRDYKLVEYNTGSKIWGVDKNYIGENKLGILLMKLRDNLIK